MSRRTYLSATVVTLSLLASMLCVAPESRAQGMGSSGTIRGTVSDTAGGSVPDARVTVKDAATGASITVKTDVQGFFEAPNVNPGDAYVVTVEKHGFATAVREKVLVAVSQPTELTFQLGVGILTQSVTVLAAPVAINTKEPDLQTSIMTKTAEDLPLQLTGAIRDVESFMYLTPGVVGNGFNTRINGGPDMTYEMWVDGVPFPINDHQGDMEGQQPPYDAIDQFTVMTQYYDASAGTAASILNIHLKSGTNSLHGDFYEFNRNNHLDARGHFAASSTTELQNEYGFSVGGPMYFPKIYDGRNKVFFFATYDEFKYRGGVSTALETLPTTAMQGGDFTHWVNSAGQLIPIYDPATTQPDGSGGFTRQQFQCNGVLNMICPDRFSALTKAFLPLIPAPMYAGAINNEVSSSKSVVDQHYWTWKGDININPQYSLHMSESYSGFTTPSSPAFPGPLGRYDIVPTLNTMNIVSMDMTLRPNLQNKVGIAFYRSYGHDFPEPINTTLTTPISPTGVPFPAIEIAGEPTYGAGSVSWINGGGPCTSVIDSLVWIKGRHTLKFGGDFRWLDEPDTRSGDNLGTYGFSNLETSLPDSPQNVTLGSGFASFLLGDVDSFDKTGTTGMHNLRTAIRQFYAQDGFRVTPRLTLTYGVRWGWYDPVNEQFNRLSTFDPNVSNPGAGGLLGAIVYEGANQGGPCISTGNANNDASLCRKYISDVHHNDWEPRIGIAYRFANKTVFRLGYGINSFLGGADSVMGPMVANNYLMGFQADRSIPSTGGGVPAFQWDGVIPSVPPLALTRDGSNGQAVQYMGRDNSKVAYVQNWSFTVERELPSEIALTLSYVGTKSTRTGANMENLNQVPSTWLSLGSALEQDISCLSAGTCPAAVAAGVKIPYSGFTGTVAQALRPYPQFAEIDSNTQETGSATYDALQVRAQKYYSNGASFLIAYVASKNLNNTGYQFATFNSYALDTADRKREKALDPMDMSQTLKISGTYDLPFGPNKRYLTHAGPVGKIVGGWEVAGILNYFAGTPIGLSGGPVIPIFNDSHLQGWDTPSNNRPNVVPGVAQKSFSGGKFDPAIDKYLNPNAWSQPAPYTFGNAPHLEPSLRGFPSYNENISLIKRTVIRESMNIEFRAELYNAFNRTVYCGPDSNLNDTIGFGLISGQCNTPKQVQFALKFNF